jgi:hypothetical protein
MRPLVVLVGGFLGAGKTTLIGKAARILQARGIVVAAVMNDQGGNLVDTEMARHSGIPADEVVGGCLCCRFPDLIEALARLAEYEPAVVFVEAVGSCTDIVATTLRPLLRDYALHYRIAPFTVIVHREPQDPDLRFLFDKQREEADLVITRETDVTGWVDQLLAGDQPAGTKTIEVDYQRYAEAEAALGWLNAQMTVHPSPELSPAMIVGPLMDELDARLTAAGICIVHLKVIAKSDTGYVKAALTRRGEEPAVEGALDASPAARHDLLVNLRALGDPSEMRKIVEGAFSRLDAAPLALQAFRPAVPVPYQRA